MTVWIEKTWTNVVAIWCEPGQLEVGGVGNGSVNPDRVP